MTEAPLRAAPPLAAFPSRRHTLAEWGAALGMLCLPALVVSMPGGLLPFGLLLLASSLLALQRMRRAAAGLQPSLRWLGVLALLVIGLSLFSLLYFGQPLKDIDNRTRFLVLPWTALWVYALRPPRHLLWWGALLGIFATLVLAIVQVLQGQPRAEGWTNAIVLADVVLVLMVVAVFCRPHGRWPWTIVALVAGCATILFSGSRGVWLGMLLLLVVTALCVRWRSGRARLVILGVLAALAWTETAPVSVEHFNLGGNRSVPTMVMVETIAEALGITPSIEWAPMQPGDVQQTAADLTKSSRILGYQPRTPFPEGIRRFVSWYREAYGRGD
jgi:O-antigen ligase